MVIGVADKPRATNLIFYWHMNMTMNPELRLILQDHRFKIRSVSRGGNIILVSTSDSERDGSRQVPFGFTAERAMNRF